MRGARGSLFTAPGVGEHWSRGAPGASTAIRSVDTTQCNISLSINHVAWRSTGMDGSKDPRPPLSVTVTVGASIGETGPFEDIDALERRMRTDREWLSTNQNDSRKRVRPSPQRRCLRWLQQDAWRLALPRQLPRVIVR